MRVLRVGFESALDFWRAARLAAPSGAELEPEGRVSGARPLALSEQVDRALALCETDAPLDVVASDVSGRANCPSLRNRVWAGPVSERHLVWLADDVRVYRPAVVFTQMATVLDEVGLAELGYELAGTYALDPDAPYGFVTNAVPLAEVFELRKYAQAARALGVRGAARALRALELVVDGSNSPRESSIGIFLATSRARGGAGAPGFRMNVSVTLPDDLAGEIGQRVIRPDFSWPNGTVGEYDSNQVHLTPAARARDERKRRAFRAVGMDCVTMVSGDFSSNERLNALVTDLERSLGVHRRGRASESILAKRSAFRERLFGPESIPAALRALNS